MTGAADERQRAIERCGGSSHPLIGGLARIVRDVGLAKSAQDALVMRWSVAGDGHPEQPGRWLMATAKHPPLTASGATWRWSKSMPCWARAGNPTGAGGTDLRPAGRRVGDDLLR